MQIRNFILAMAAAAASGLLFYFGTRLHPISWLLWLAPIPVLAIASRMGCCSAFVVALTAWLIGALNFWRYARNVLQIPLLLIAIFFLFPATFFGLGLLFTRSFVRRGWLFAAALSFPAYWVTYEYLTETASPHSTFGNLAYTQMNFLPLIQIASIAGIWSISFVVFLFAATVAILCLGIGSPSRRRALAISVGTIVCGILLLGEWRLSSPSSDKSVAVVLIAEDAPMKTSEEQALALLQEYADELRRDTPVGTTVAVLPEKIVRVSEEALSRVDALLSAAAADVHSAIVVGLVRQTAGQDFNSSRFYSSDGKLEANYAKQHLIPGIEPQKPGNKRVLVDQSSERWGLQICKDMDFPKLSRDYARDGANLLLVPAWDFNLDGWLHAQMAVLRTVEDGFALARSARNGLLTLSDNRGRIIGEKPTITDQFVSVSGNLTVGQTSTFYARTGDWFPWFCVALFIGLFASLFLRERRATPIAAS